MNNHIAKIGIVIPCYNESGNLPVLINRCKHVLSKIDCEFLLVDNGSTDNTFDLFNSFEGILGIRYLRLEHNLGYGGGILAGLNSLKNEFLGWTHADLQTDPADIVNLELEQTNNWQFLKGSRIKRKAVDNFFTLGMSIVMSFLFFTRLSDINAQPTIVSRDLFLSWESPPKDFSFDLYAFVMARKKSAKISRFPVNFSSRLAGNSKWNSGIMARLRMSNRTFKYALQLKRELGK